jgi:NAD(P)-dependent dehydrogenase (short-subunit alcohol dehydrogenase family)
MVNAIAPGLVDTEMGKPLLEAGVAERIPVRNAPALVTRSRKRSYRSCATPTSQARRSRSTAARSFPEMELIRRAFLDPCGTKWRLVQFGPAFEADGAPQMWGFLYIVRRDSVDTDQLVRDRAGGPTIETLRSC